MKGIVRKHFDHLNPDPLIHAKGSVTLLLELGRKANLHAPTRDKD